MIENPLSQSQIDWAMDRMAKWWEIRQGLGRSVHSPSDVAKSHLLARLLSGAEPMPDPPPTFGGAPWYEVMESGPQWVPAEMVSPLGVFEDGCVHVSIGGCDDWVLAEADPEFMGHRLGRVHPITRVPTSEEWVMYESVAHRSCVIGEVATDINVAGFTLARR